MSTIDVNNLLVSSSKENIFAKILVIATGAQVRPVDMEGLLYLHDRDGDYSGIADLVISYMTQKVVDNGGSIVETVAQVMGNATGEPAVWTSEKAQSFINEMAEQGVSTWPGLFEYLIKHPSSEYGSKLDQNVKNYLAAYGVTPEDEVPGDQETSLPPGVADQFITPTGGDFYATVPVRDANNQLIKEFHFDAPKMLFTGNANIFDFSGGDKTLAVLATEYKNIFGLQKDTFFLNFSEGDKVVIIDNSRFHPTFSMNKDKAYFDNESINSDEFVWQYDPERGLLNEGDSLVRLDTFAQWNGDHLAFPTNGVPAELASLADPYLQTVHGIEYGLNLRGDDIFDDGQLIIVGSDPQHLNADNFVFNDPAYIV